ncbi:class I SAM-dependent methyltransferase [Citricoccus sp.]|uniref:class I SAM-dependent methyltransferase n=1 Tax=Citricoccus sp. TaxID=1978372 RepID=UPI0028BD4BA2|nr:class I SAM-dependent methyltransferase [Citricoccus sp.]
MRGPSSLGLPALSLRERRPSTVEQMDRPDCDLDALHRTYRGFGVVNPVVAGWQLTYRRWIRPLLETARTVTVLDIGSGGGDRPRAVARQARRDGFRVNITAIDPDARAHAWATARPAVPGLAFRRAVSGDLVAAGERYDVVVSNHLLHHLEPAELDGLLADSERLAVRRAIHSDIRRSPAAYALFSAGAGLATPLFPGSFIRPDGLASIRRSYTPGELAAVLRPGWRVHTQLPWRNLAVWDAR